MIEYINKDVTTLKGSKQSPIFLLHGVNCQITMRSGVAKAISDKWPIVKEQYMRAPANLSLLGNIQIVEVDPDRLFVSQSRSLTC